MIDQLLNSGKQYLSKELKQNACVSEDKVEQTLEVSKGSIVSSLIGQATGGNLNAIMGLFNGKTPADTSNPMVSSMVNNLTGDLASKVGIDKAKAQQAATLIVPFVMQKFASKETGTAENEVDLLKKAGLSGSDALSGLMSSFMGGKGDSNMLGKLGKFFK
ncbi:MAG: hypothetical protein JJT94_11025 [Bernardetiaceae bacterium]|nr:hypothetical protein [Bernardetiaceae bacterium]